MADNFVHIHVTPPLDAGALSARITQNLARGLAEADPGPLKTLTIVANGPSAHDAGLTGPTLALNGALKLFTERNLAPTYWAACDPLECVADFIPDHPPEETLYLVGSKCHPRVFDRLKGRDVRLWHVDDGPIPSHLNAVKTAVSITLVSMPLMRRVFGYRQFEVYGWDACFQQGEHGVRHHASDASFNTYPAETIDICVGATPDDKGQMQGGDWFKTLPCWMAEAQDMVTQLHHADYRVNVHGQGLIAAMKAQLRR